MRVWGGEKRRLLCGTGASWTRPPGRGRGPPSTTQEDSTQVRLVRGPEVSTCLAGAEDRTVAVGDLRFDSWPASARAGAGEVWGVRFSGSSGAEMPGGGSLSAGYLCTGEGAVGLVHTAPGGALEVRAVAQESGSAVGMDVRGTGSAEDVACVTSHECLTFLHSRVTAA